MNKSAAIKTSGNDRARIADRVLGDIRDRIVSGAIPKGAKLPTERELAEHFDVSVPTIREAIRGLTATGMIVVRHGSGAYVTANTASLLAMSLKNVIQIEKLAPVDLLNVVGALIIQAARLAADAATNADKARLFAALEPMDRLETVDGAAAALRAFHEALAQASHNPLLAALYDYFSNLLVELSAELTGELLENWRQVFAALKPLRQKLVQAIAAGDAEGAMRAAEVFHDNAFAIVVESPKARSLQLNDPHFEALLSRMANRIGERA